MSVNTNWDVEKHRVEHECDEHWELRRNFLETHKDKFPEDELVCLAQVFTNVELLGCRYPKETMNLIAELSADVARDYRARQKTKLQRTFVKASDAASSKIKGLRGPQHSPSTGSTTSHSLEPPTEDTGQRPSKRPRLDNEKPFGDLVLVQYPQSAAADVIERSAAVSGMKVEWKHEIDKQDSSTYRCHILFGEKKLIEAQGTSKKLAKAEAAKRGLEILRKYYYLIEIKQQWAQNLNSNTDFSEKLNGTKKPDERSKECLGQDNVGAKLMKLMGWAGGGLGKSQQGITEPIAVPRKISRRGFGVTLNQSNRIHFKTKFRETLQQYIRDGAKDDLVFCDFDNDERALMHQIARNFGLKSHSRGGKDQRTLLISRKINPKDLLDELLEIGGSTGKYELKAPTG
ncbi:NF-kappa-B-repressing factor [Diachasma alloeum]|uniref:NF-kappa-B-repressing factor n=1 Tax=Diachasma alloeum TaxID=454923 RepID=UPI000738273B|nr:NF-kappa-B-repressing factor [Diachasma alloeum]